MKSEDHLRQLLHTLNAKVVSELAQDIEKLEEELSVLINTSKYDLSPAWPLGSPKKFKSTDRFDLNTYRHFNQSHCFFTDDYESATRLENNDIEDIGNLLNLCNVQSEDFSSGWSKLDATRGKDLILEVSHKANER